MQQDSDDLRLEEMAAIAAWDWDRGFYELVQELNDPDARQLAPELAQEIVDCTSTHQTTLQRNLLRVSKQHRAAAASTVAELDAKEVVPGQMLGRGGFSTVYEVLDFHPYNNDAAKKKHSKKKKAENSKIIREPLSLAQEQARRNLFAKTSSSSPNSNTPQQQRSKSSLFKDKKLPHSQHEDGDDSGLPYAARYALKHLRSSFPNNDKLKRAAIDLVLEAELLKNLHHPNIIRLHGMATGGPAAFGSGYICDYFLILDRLVGTLEERMLDWKLKFQRTKKKMQAKIHVLPSLFKKKRTPDHYPTKMRQLALERMQAAADIASAVAYLHSRRILHRDLKTSNIGFNYQGNVILFDLGLARLLPPDTTTTTAHGTPSAACMEEENKDEEPASFVMSRVGTKFYMPPEVRNKQPYNTAADIYSFGVVLWEILALSSPRDLYQQYREAHYSKKGGQKQHDSDKLNYETIKAYIENDDNDKWLELCPCWHSDLRNLVRMCLAKRPTDRPTMKQVHQVLTQKIAILSDSPDGSGATATSESFVVTEKMHHCHEQAVTATTMTRTSISMAIPKQ
jgi:serine/threonine protein kinase